MNIAVACNGLDVASRLDSAECFTFYAAPKGVLSGCRTFPNPKKPIEDLVELMKALSMDVLICQSMTQGELDCFNDAGLEVLLESKGTASSAARTYLANHMSCDFFEED